MKKLFLLIACLAVMTAYAQNSGLGFNYQAVVRNSEGVLLPDTLVNLRVSLYPGQYASTPTWVETHSIRTDFTGSFGIMIGQGERDASSIVGAYSDVNFAAIYYWMKIEILEGSSYREVSFTNLPSCPYCDNAFNASPLPAGIILAFGGDIDSVPSGFLPCTGAIVSKNEYPELYRRIKNYYGHGDDPTTFKLPDLRGMFLRGVSGDSGNDPDAHLRVNEHGGNTGNNVGSIQDYATPRIQGTIAANDLTDNVSQPTATGPYYTFWSGYRDAKNGADGGNYGIGFDNSLVTNTSTESRPKNVYVNYIIKY